MNVTAVGIGVPFRHFLGGTPAAQDEIIQWLKGGTTDGLTLDYKVQTITNDAVYADVPCVQFDGVGDYASISNHGLSGINSGSIVVAVNITTLKNHSNILGDTHAGSSEPGLYLTCMDDGAIRFSNKTGSGLDELLAPAGSLAPNTRYSIAITWVDIAGTFHKKVYLNGSLIASKTTTLPITEGHTQDIRLSGAWSSALFTEQVVYSLALYDIALSPELLAAPNESIAAYSLEEFFGPTAYDISGNGNHGTLIPTEGAGNATGIARMRNATANGISNHNALYGFRELAGVQIPALLDGSSAADGNPITNPPGFVHNDGNYSIAEDDTFFTSGTINFYSSDGTTRDVKTKADFDAHPNGQYNLWLKYDGGNIVHHVQYPLNKIFTQDEYNQNVSFFGGTPIGGIVPFSPPVPVSGSIQSLDVLAQTDSSATGLSLPTFSGGIPTIQTDFGIIDSIEVTGTGTIVDTDIPWFGTFPTPTWQTVDTNVNLGTTGSEWVLEDFITFETWYHSPSTTAFPDKSAWPIGSLGSPAPVVSYDSFWEASAEFATKIKADYENHPNGLNNLWLRFEGTTLTHCYQYPLSRVLTAEEITQNKAFFGPTPSGGFN